MDSSGPNHRDTPGTRIRDQWPGANWEIDYIGIKPGIYGYKHLLVFIDIISEWVEATKETATVMAKKLLEETIPKYGLLTMFVSLR